MFKFAGRSGEEGEEPRKLNYDFHILRETGKNRACSAELLRLRSCFPAEAELWEVRCLRDFCHLRIHCFGHTPVALKLPVISVHFLVLPRKRSFRLHILSRSCRTAVFHRAVLLRHGQCFFKNSWCFRCLCKRIELVENSARRHALLSHIPSRTATHRSRCRMEKLVQKFDSLSFHKQSTTLCPLCVLSMNDNTRQFQRQLAFLLWLIQD